MGKLGAFDSYIQDEQLKAEMASCQTCNGHGMIGGLLPNGGGYESEPCPECSNMQSNAEKCREAFEKWANRGFMSLVRDPQDNEDYFHHTTSWAFAAWKARSEQPPTQHELAMSLKNMTRLFEVNMDHGHRNGGLEHDKETIKAARKLIERVEI